MIVVIFGMKNGYKVLDDNFESIYGDLGVYLNGQKIGSHDHA